MTYQNSHAHENCYLKIFNNIQSNKKHISYNQEKECYVLIIVAVTETTVPLTKSSSDDLGFKHGFVSRAKTAFSRPS